MTNKSKKATFGLNLNIKMTMLAYLTFCVSTLLVSTNMASRLGNELDCDQAFLKVSMNNSIVTKCLCRWLDSRKADHS